MTAPTLSRGDVVAYGGRVYVVWAVSLGLAHSMPCLDYRQAGGTSVAFGHRTLRVAVDERRHISVLEVTRRGALPPEALAVIQVAHCAVVRDAADIAAAKRRRHHEQIAAAQKARRRREPGGVQSAAFG